MSFTDLSNSTVWWFILMQSVNQILVGYWVCTNQSGIGSFWTFSWTPAPLSYLSRPDIWILRPNRSVLLIPRWIPGVHLYTCFNTGHKQVAQKHSGHVCCLRTYLHKTILVLLGDLPTNNFVSSMRMSYKTCSIKWFLQDVGLTYNKHFI